MGTGVGVGVGVGVAVAVGSGVGVAVGRAVGVGVGVAVAVGSGVGVAVGRAVGVGVAASGTGVFVRADVGACVGSGLTPCSDEVVVLESVPFEGMRSGSSEHPVSRMASAAMPNSRPIIDLGIDFMASTSLT